MPALGPRYSTPLYCQRCATRPKPDNKAVAKAMQTTHRALERCFLKTSLRQQRQQGIRSSELREKSQLADPLQYMKKSKYRWAGHLLRRKDDRWSLRRTESPSLDASCQRSSGLEELWSPLRRSPAEERTIKVSNVLCPIYLTEVSPINLRGAIGSVHQLVITIAILVSQILGLPQIFGTTDGWPLIFWFIVVPAFLQIICLKFVPESPRFTLCMRGNIEQATRDLQKLRGSSDVASEIDALNNEAEANKEGSVSKPTMRDMFKDPLKWPMTIALVLMLIQQLSGINAVMFYSTVIFKTAGLTDEAAVYATIAMGTVNVLMTIVSVWLVDHPRAGRRSLLLMSLSGMWITTILLTICISLSMGGAQWASYGAITSVLLYVVSFASGTGSIPWFFVSEIFHSNSRANANSIAITTNWSANIVVSMAFLPLNNAIKQYSILVFTVCLTASLVFTWKYVPETKGRTVDEITEELTKQ
ncbi:unnamed protein product [Nippostrongylus brasiliensis]|uniref:Facilitated glucose transporter protein 1 (inferred by orthology to a C. elegans protein) n=1 Tax=Nippostrongylus brasiliensis TaxID=27835 RepID=A0A0N4XU88_NIPBR|nr:unnamed protein product [Nippostrongylus brasiliensis]